jgi:hypothetical protein
MPYEANSITALSYELGLFLSNTSYSLLLNLQLQIAAMQRARDGRVCNISKL